MSRTTLLLVALMLSMIPVVGLAKREVHVVSAVGRAALGGKHLKAGDTLVARGVLEVERHGVAQLLWTGGTNFVVTLFDGAEGRMLDETTLLRLDRGAARLAGAGRVRVGEILLTLQADAVVLVRADRALLLEGRAEATLAGQRTTLEVGKVAWLVDRVPPGGGYPRRALRLAADNPRLPSFSQRERLRSLRHGAPPRWTPMLGEQGIQTQVRKVRQRVERQQERQREMASCGCTESAGAGPEQGKGGTTTPVEQRVTRMRVEVRGVPRRLP